MQLIFSLLIILNLCTGVYGSTAVYDEGPVPKGVFVQFSDGKRGNFYHTTKQSPSVDFENSPEKEALARAAEFCRYNIVDYVIDERRPRLSSNGNFPSIFRKINIDNIQPIEEGAKKVGLNVIKDAMDEMSGYARFILKGRELDPDVNAKLSVFSPIPEEQKLTISERHKLFYSIFGPEGTIGTDYYELSGASEKYTFECALFVLFFPLTVIKSVSSFFANIFTDYSREKAFYYRCLCGAIRKFLEEVDGITVERYSPTSGSDVSIIAAYYAQHFKSGKSKEKDE